MTAGRPQKGKHRKRAKHWHRGRAEDQRWRRAQLPDTDSGADPTTGRPHPLSRARRYRNRGDAL